MAGQLLLNNVTTKLTSQLLTGGTTANVTAGSGALFAGATGGNYIRATLVRISGFKEVAWEVVYVTARSTDALTITRAQEGTTALQFEIDDRLEVRMTAKTRADVTGIWCGTAGGTANALTLTPATPILAYEAGMSFIAMSSASANTGATTVAISGLGTIAVQSAGAACTGDEIPASKLVMFTLDSATTAQVARFTEAGIYAALAGNAAQAFSMTTAAQGTNTTQGASTAFVQAEVGLNDNRVINGLGLVQQIAAPTLTAADQYGAADMHQISVSGGTSISGTAGVATNTGFDSEVGYGAIAASWTTGQFLLRHRISYRNTIDLNGETITVSGKLYQDTGGSRTFTIGLRRPTTTADVFSALTTITEAGSQVVATGAVTPFSFTYTLGSTDASKGLEITIFDSAANTVSNKNYLIGDLRLDKGSIAKRSWRHYEDELWLCYYYYYRIFPGIAYGVLGDGTANTATTSVIWIKPPRPMRIAPSGIEQSGTAGDYEIFYAGGNYACTSVPAFQSGTTELTQVLFTSTGVAMTAGWNAHGYTVATTAFIGLSARL